MGSYDNIVKLEEIHKRVEEGNYQSALKILETIDKKKMKNIKNISDLSLMAEVYEENERYEEAMEILDKIYIKSKTRKVLYQMIWVCIKSNRIPEAEELMEEYEKIAPQDYYNYIFRYKIDKLRGEPYDKLIKTLEDLKKIEYREQWAYELAKCYYKAGFEHKCIRECSDIILWFGDGIYVEKAKMLKAYYSGETDKVKMLEELRRRSAGEPAEDTVTAKEDDREGAEDKEQTESAADVSEPSDGDSESRETLTEEEAQAIESNLLLNIQSFFTEGAQEEDQEYPENRTAGGIEQESEQEIGQDTGHNGEEETREEPPAEEEINAQDRQIRMLSQSLGVSLEDIFGDYLHREDVRKQLLYHLELILDEYPKSIQLMITGHPGSGKTSLAKAISIFLYKAGKLGSSKVAKIKAEKLNRIDVMAKKESLKDCCLVVENAGELKRESIAGIMELIHYYQGAIAVIFEENEKNMQKLDQIDPPLMELFKNRIHLPQ